MSRPRSRYLQVFGAVLALKLLTQLAFCQLPTLSYRSELLEEPAIIRKAISKDICGLRELDEASYYCEPLENSTTAAYLQINCDAISAKDSKFLILGSCQNVSDLSGDLASLGNCQQFKCDMATGVLTLLVVKVSGRREHSAAMQHFERDFRFRESTRRLKLSPTPVHLLYKKSQLFLDLSKKSTPWISPFYGKFVAYYIGSDEHIPTLDWSFQSFERGIFDSLVQIQSQSDLDSSEGKILSAFETTFGISWIISTIMETYWARGIAQPPSASDGYDPETGSFDAGLSYRTYCSLNFSSFIFNMKQYTDYIIHMNTQSDTEKEIENIQADNIREIFSYSMIDLDSLYLTYSPNEISTRNSSLAEEDLLDQPFPCMSKYRSSHKLRRTPFDHYSAGNVDRSFHGSDRPSKAVHEDVYVLVGMIHTLFSKYIVGMHERNPFLAENNDRIRRYSSSYRAVFSKISKLKSEVEEVCGRRAFKAFLKSSARAKGSSSSTNSTSSGTGGSSRGSGRGARERHVDQKDGPVCSLRYSLEVVRRLESIFFSMFNDYRYYELRRSQLNSPEYLLRSTYCLSSALFGSNYRDVPNEAIIKAVLPNSIIYKYQSSSKKSLMSECLKELRHGELASLVDLESNSLICERYSGCMFARESLSTAVDIFRRLTEIDREGGFHEKSRLVREMCSFSGQTLGLEPAGCQAFRLVQLALRTSQFQQEVVGFKFRTTLADKSGNSYFIPDSSTVSYLLINDFCMDPEIASLIQCSFDWEAFTGLEELRRLGGGDAYERRTNFIVLQDGSRIHTPLYFRETTDTDFINLSNGVLFARILDAEGSPGLRLTYFSGLPLPYHGGNEDIRRRVCERPGGSFAYSPESSNLQRILVLKLSYASSPISLIVDDDYFDNQTLIRNSKIFREKFSIIDTPGLSVPLTTSLLQIESTTRSRSPCNSVLFPYLMIQEFINPLNLEKSDDLYEEDFGVGPGDEGSEDERTLSYSPANTMDDIVYPTDLESVMEKILRVEPLALNFIMTGRGHRYLKMILKASYYMGYHSLTTLLSFWTGGSRFRQHCDMHWSNVLTRFPSSWKKLKWEQYVTRILDSVDQRYFSIIDLDFSYESEMKITNLQEDIERLPDKDPCHHPSVMEKNSLVSRNDYERIMDFFCDLHMSLGDFFGIASESYPSRSVISELSSSYPDIMSIHNYTMEYCEDARSLIKDLESKGEADLASGFKMAQHMRRTIWSSILGLEQLGRREDREPEDRDLLSRFLLSGRVRGESGTIPGREPGSERRPGSLRRSDAWLQGMDGSRDSVPGLRRGEEEAWGDFPGRVVPEMVASLEEQSLSFYCTAGSVRRLVDIPSLRFADLLNFLLQRSSLEGYIRQIHFGPSFEEFEPTRSKLQSVEHLRLECMRSMENRRIVEELMPLLYDRPEVVCPRSICTTVRHYDIFESMISVYRYRLNHLVSTAYHLSDTFDDADDQVLSLRVWVVERDSTSGSVRRRPLSLRLEQINSLLELYQFCTRDRYYSSLSAGQLECKTIPEFEALGEDSNGLLILELSSITDGSSSTMLFPWVYNSNFSVFESEFSFKEVNGVSVVGVLRPPPPSDEMAPGVEASGSGPQSGDERRREYFIHKGSTCIYDHNSRIDEYKVPPNVVHKVSEDHETLYRLSFNGYGRMEMNHLSVFTFGDERVSLYSWVRGILDNVRRSSPQFDGSEPPVFFSSIPSDHQTDIITLAGIIVRAFKSIWIPNPECKHYSRVKTVCFPMFCGISSKNIILKIGDNQRIKGIKFLFGQDIKVLNAYNQEGPEVPRSRNGPSELEDLVSVSHVLPNNCNGNYDEANDMIAVASTLEYLTAVIATGSPLDPLKLFSSNMSDTYYRYFKMTMEETIGQVNRFCEILQGYSGSKNRIC